MHSRAAGFPIHRSIAVSVCFTLVLCGCSPVMAIRQPTKKDLDVLDRGTPREAVIAELGRPATIGQDEEGYYCHETYAFEQGYSGWVKGGRATFHALADVFTLFLWEVIGTPTELYFDGTEVRLEVLYDENDRVDSVCVFSGADAVESNAEVPTDIFRERLSEVREKSRLEPEPVVTTSAARQRLLDIQELRDSGLISEEEYEEQRAKILEQMNAPRP